MRGTDAQELSNGQDPTFEAWRLQIEARFGDDPSWYNTEKRKLDYMLRRTSGDAQTHMIAGMKDKRLPGFFKTAQDALAALRQALTNPQAVREAQNQFRALRMGATESFAQFRTRFLLLAHESNLRPDDYRDELWYKITPALGSAIVAVQAQLVTYDQLADCLLSADTSLRWLNPPKAAPTANTITRRERNRIGQFQAASPAPLSLGRPQDRISASPSFPTSSSSPRPSVPPKHMPSTSQTQAGDACFNCGQAGHWSPECPQPRTSRTELKELQEALESDSDDEPAAGRPGKDTLWAKAPA